MRFIILFSVLLLLPILSPAQGRGGSGSKKIISISFMALNGSTTQGGAGPSGSSILTRTEFIWAYNHWGVGAMFDYDLHGSNEKDSAYGIKFETYLSNFFLEAGYFLSAKRAYTDRAIAEETGDGIVLGLGARFSFSKSGGSGGPFFQASYKLKTQNLKKQDGVDLSEPIKQEDGYPVFGFGLSF